MTHFDFHALKLCELGKNSGKQGKKWETQGNQQGRVRAEFKGSLYSLNKDRIVFKVPFLPPASAGERKGDENTRRKTLPTLNTSTMKKTLKRLPILLAVICTLLVSACSEIEVNPRGDGDDDEPPIIIVPQPPQNP